MFPTFTGNSRRPRQVNLSGRNANPFAHAHQGGGLGSSLSVGFGGSHSALVNAQQERMARQQERERTRAATVIQRTWRGAVARRHIEDMQRRQWDAVEAGQDKVENGRVESADLGPEWPATKIYTTDAEGHSQARLLARFMKISDSQDWNRYVRLLSRLHSTFTSTSGRCAGGSWPRTYSRLQNICLVAIEQSNCNWQQAIRILRWLVQVSSTDFHSDSPCYYKAMATLIEAGVCDDWLIRYPLTSSNSAAATYFYRDFVLNFLALSKLHRVLGHEGKSLQTYDLLSALVDGPNPIDCKRVCHAVAEVLSESTDEPQRILRGDERRLWLLSNLIHLVRCQNGMDPTVVPNFDFVLVVAKLLAPVADVIEVESSGLEDESDSVVTSRRDHGIVLDPFARDQITSLVNQETISALLNLTTRAPDDSALTDKARIDVLASYVLTLLRLFPRQSDEIRMWVYLGPVRSEGATGDQVSIIRYLWRGLSNTFIYQTVCKDARAAISLLKSRGATKTMSGVSAESCSQHGTDDEWKIIFLFIELYTFVLKVMDDQEFFASKSLAIGGSPGKLSNLLLPEIKDLTTFLKHLGFTMYYNVTDITGDAEEQGNKAIADLFKLPGTTQPLAAESGASDKLTLLHAAGVHEMSLDHMKGLVIGLLRAIYERDSRRPFLPPGHWLMTSQFDMANFISAVVEEEERRRKVEEEDGEDNDDDHEILEDAEQASRPRLTGNARAERSARLARIQRQHRKASRRRYLQAVAPRLEIIQNMPFLIPFSTRVQIFRQFVLLDQSKRRAGVMDPDLWRFQQANGTPMGRQAVQRHHANIRRGHEFDDAFEQFYDLGDALKEPMQITFLDRFGTEEAGIDGGGVTKEFLTSVTSQAFAPTATGADGAGGGIDLFVANEQHLLYPNPAAVDEQRQLLRDAGFGERSVEFRDELAELQRRYEFLGRVVGKCLYEAILVDIRFAGFFLLKWSLTGSGGSGYKANINDLRDFDEGLYQGLLQLKNYPGNVEDFSLNFTVTDTVSSSISSTTSSSVSTFPRTITRDLIPHGSTISVTNTNRLIYISLMARHRLSSQPLLQTTAFLRGLSAIVQPSWLRMFNQLELQTLVGGGGAPIDVRDLRAHTRYGGVYAIGDDGREHESVAIFWDVMHELPDGERRKVLKFVTSTPRAPLLGFASLVPGFSIRDAGADEARLPSTSTCVNLLKLPMYRGKERCREKLLQAVNAGAGFDLS